MTDTQAQPAIRHDARAGRFSTEVDGVEAELEYRLDGDHITILHTGVPEEIGGRGIAGRLVQAAMDHARAQGLKVHPACAYASAWMDKHPEYRDLRV